MEEDIKNMSKEELLEYLEEISQQLDNIALDQIKIAIAELQYFKDQYKQLEEENKTLKNFTSYIFNEDVAELIPTSLVKEKIEEYKKLIKEVQDNEEHYNEIPLYEHDIEVLQELLEEGVD